MLIIKNSRKNNIKKHNSKAEEQKANKFESPETQLMCYLQQLSIQILQSSTHIRY